MSAYENDLPNQSSSNRLNVPPAPKGTQLGRIYGVVYAGPFIGDFQGKPKYGRTVFLLIELVNKKVVFKEGEAAMPYGLNYEFNLIKGEKSTMAKFAPLLFGTTYSDEWYDSFNIKDLLGMYVYANIAHVTKDPSKPPFANVIGINPTMEETVLTPGVNEDFFYDVQLHGTWSEQWLRLPQWLRTRFMDSRYKRHIYFEQIKHAGCTIWDYNSKPNPVTGLAKESFMGVVQWEEFLQTLKLRAQSAHMPPAQQAAPQSFQTPPPPAENFPIPDDDDDLPF